MLIFVILHLSLTYNFKVGESALEVSNHNVFPLTIEAGSSGLGLIDPEDWSIPQSSYSDSPAFIMRLYLLPIADAN